MVTFMFTCVVLLEYLTDQSGSEWEKGVRILKFLF